MQLISFCVITSTAIVALTFLLWKSQKLTLSSLEILNRSQSRQIQMNQTLTNLLLSKDPMTFQGLQAMSNQSQNLSQFEEAVNPMDDASVAHQLAEQYKRHGLDPNQAYAKDDDVDWNAEFGLNM